MPRSSQIRRVTDFQSLKKPSPNPSNKFNDSVNFKHVLFFPLRFQRTPNQAKQSIYSPVLSQIYPLDAQAQDSLQTELC